MAEATAAKSAFEITQALQGHANQVMYLCQAVTEALVDAASWDESEKGRQSRADGIDRAIVFLDLAEEISRKAYDDSNALEMMIGSPGRPANAIKA